MFFDRFRLFASAFTYTCAKYVPAKILTTVLVILARNLNSLKLC